MKNLKKLSREDLKMLRAGIGPANPGIDPSDPGTGEDELTKCGTTWCARNYQCCYHSGGQFYYCSQSYCSP